MSEVQKSEPFVYWADCADPDQSAMCWHKEDALTQINDHGGTLYELSHTSELDAQRLRADTAEAEREDLKKHQDILLQGAKYARSRRDYWLKRGDRLQNDLAAAEQRIAELQGREVLDEAEGVLTFMRSESDSCGCCEGQHVFCRYFEGVRSFDDFSQNTRFRNDLEGRRFRISIELIPDAALNPKPEAGSHE